MTAPQKTQWEYFVETVGSAFSGPKDDALEEILNELGDEGWEVFSMENLSQSPKIRIVARRPTRLSYRGK